MASCCVAGSDDGPSVRRGDAGSVIPDWVMAILRSGVCYRTLGADLHVSSGGLRGGKTAGTGDMQSADPRHGALDAQASACGKGRGQSGHTSAPFGRVLC